jgi:hypothetical protein
MVDMLTPNSLVRGKVGFEVVVVAVGRVVDGHVAAASTGPVW